MSTTESARGHASVIQPSEGDSFWQPVPANGHADPKLTPANTRYDELVMLWMVSPAGLENFFKAIGRPRAAGEAAPAPFARPENGVEIERASGMTYKHPGPPTHR